jgi:O-antigen ligase
MLVAGLCAVAAAAGMGITAGDVSAVDLGLTVLGAAVLLVAAMRPDAGAALLLAVMLLLPRTTLFERGAPFLGGQVKATDLLLATVVGAWLVRRVVGLDSNRLPARWAMALLAVFYATVLIAMVTAQRNGTALDLSLQELRPLLAYLLIFPLVGSVRSLRDLELGLRVLLGVAAVASVITLVRYFNAPPADAGGAYAGLTRVLDDAFLAPMCAVTWAAAVFPYTRSLGGRLALAVVAGVGLSALFVTFQRGAWVAAVTAVVVTIAALPPRLRSRLLKVVAAAVAIIAIVALGAAARSDRSGTSPVEAGLERIKSIEFFQGDPSAQHRTAEWSRAGQAIREHPAFGIGLGSGIVFYSPLFREETDTIGNGFRTYYIHNSYIWFALKLGIAGAVAFFALVFGSTYAGWRAFKRSIDPRAKPLLLGSVVGLVALLVLSVTGPHLNFDRSTTYAATLVGLVQVVPLLARTRLDGR